MSVLRSILIASGDDIESWQDGGGSFKADGLALTTSVNAGMVAVPDDKAIAYAGPDVAIQAFISKFTSGVHRDQFSALVGPKVRFLVLLGMKRPQEIRDADVHVREFELERDIEPGQTRMVIGVGSAAALFSCADFIRATDRVSALVLDTDAYAVDMRLTLTPERRELDYARSHLATVARALRVLAYDMSGIAEEEPPVFDADTLRLRSFGFSGRYVRNQEQAAVVNRVFGSA